LRFLTILIALYSLVLARQNPFKPVIDDTVLPTTTNQVKKVSEFKEVRINLPNDARVLKSVTIFYQSIDGSIKKVNSNINKSIDWHTPLTVIQNRLKSTSKIEKKKREDSKTIYKPLPFISFKLEKNRIKIVTDDKKIRSFHLTDPFKIVIDLARDANFLTKKVHLNKPPFVKLDIGNHNGYYRVVITLDSSYKYKIYSIESGYIVDVQ
jgi:hypothetical protein